GQGGFPGRALQGPAQAGGGGLGVVGRPGVEDGGVQDADGPGDHGGAGRQRPHRLQQLLVPLEDHVVVGRRRVLVEGVQRRRVGAVVGGRRREGRGAGGLAGGRGGGRQGDGQGGQTDERGAR